MSQDKKHIFDQESASARHVAFDQNPYGTGHSKYNGFSSRREMILASIQNYFGNGKIMMASSLSHLRNPITIIVIFLLIGLYILLGVAGTIEFSFYNTKVVQYITTNLDILVNALLGYFYGPVTCCISVALCCIVRMISEGNVFFIGYIIGASVAGFLHGWILYRHKTMWFGTRFRGFFTDLLSKVFLTRLVVSVFVNILLMAVIYKVFINYPIYEYIMHYAKSGVELTSVGEFLGVFVVSLFFETAVIFLGLAIINFIVMKAFPSQMEQPTLIIDSNGVLINLEDEMTGSDIMT
ncbi:MAG: hypothetical protein E7392_03110 [Ruminococcaceae bacterium]|nr:hypothetical protein [Oscillospiraceae bacterium]